MTSLGQVCGTDQEEDGPPGSKEGQDLCRRIPEEAAEEEGARRG